MLGAMSERDRPSGEARTTMRALRHEMRTPLGQIIGYSELLEEELQERGQADLVPDLERIRRAAGTLLGLLDGIFRAEIGAGAGTAPEESTGGETASARLLVVDDDPANCDLLVRRLGRAGYDVTPIGDGLSALRRIEQDDFDLVLLDVLMPGMGGFEVLESIRRGRSVSQLPVIMATALDGSDEVVQALRLGANDYVTKPFDLPVVLARIETQLALRGAAREIEDLARQLEIRNAFLRRTFGRYLSDEVVANLLESHEGLEIRGERRRLTILMADLRGFSSLTEVLSPVEIVSILNSYLGSMAEVIQAHLGTIDEFLGDAILAFFGAPTTREDDAERAVACAIAMQLAMQEVNRTNRERGLPAVEMGIGIATGDVVVGNVGSEKRSKYGAVGSAVNLASRIESYTLGGEILVSDATFEEVKGIVRVDHVREVWPKGFETPVRVHRVAGVGGRYALDLPRDPGEFSELDPEIAVRFSVLEGKDVSRQLHVGQLWAWSVTGARVRSDADVRELADLRIELAEGDGADGACYAKVVDRTDGPVRSFTVRFSTRPTALERRARPRS